MQYFRHSILWIDRGKTEWLNYKCSNKKTRVLPTICSYHTPLPPAQIRQPHLHEVHVVRPLRQPPLRSHQAGAPVQRQESHLSLFTLVSASLSTLSSPPPPVCSMNVHKRCKDLVANTCGVNPRLMADILHDMVRTDTTPSTVIVLVKYMGERGLPMGKRITLMDETGWWLLG